jgi:hypothetical protein
LKKVGGFLICEACTLTSLEKLEFVGDYLNLLGSNIESLGNLKFVGGELDLRQTPMSEKYSEEEIRSMVEVKGNVLL